ncbi:MAG TPA: dihydrodipicolinate synthase family protein [Terriglobia bacterium]|nr:dihydrodipicolinate synthase family protein [Terriglobia bacterium]
MAARFDRREFVLRAGRAALALPILARTSLTSAIALASPAALPKLRGIFAILETPFKPNDEMDDEDLAREVDFCVRGGAHGLVWPQLAAEFYMLMEEERMHGAEVIVRAAAGRRPVVIGVQAPMKELAVKLARHAEAKGADAVIALPPYLGHAGLDTAADYYRSLARAVKIPIFIQNSGSPWGPAMSTDFVLGLAREFPQLGYIKEEVEPVGHRLEEYAHSGMMTGIFSGNAGRNLLNELPRGSSGTMPACEFIDIDAEVYDLYAAGQHDQARELFEKLLPMINLEETYGMPFAKAVLERRGVFKTAKMRGRGAATALDTFDQQELEGWWKQLQPYFKV